MILAPPPSSILIVDDEPSFRKLVDRIPRQAGYDTLLAATAPDALRLFDANATNINMVLHHWHLPGTSGKEALAILQSRRPELRVVLMTGGREATMDEHATQDAVSVLPKPLTAMESMFAVRTEVSA